MSPKLIDALAQCRNLPSPPGIAMRVIELAQDPDADLASAAEVISLDMALSARMLRIANSPLYASRRRINNLGQALTMLGLNATLQLALGLSISQCLQQQDPRGGNGMAGQLWRRSVLNALAARQLGQACGVRRTEELMLAGLLQDIGILALLQVESERYPQLLAQADSNADLVRLEREQLGFTHADAGAAVASEWNLPQYLVDAIAASESTETPADTFQACVALSRWLSDIWFAADADAARETALRLTDVQLHLACPRFDEVIAQIDELLPDISSLFEVPMLTPARVANLIEHARELAMLRTLREQQDLMLSQQRALELEQRASRMAELAHRDALTGVLNRRQLEVVLDQEFARASREDAPLSLAFIDLDDFKKVNDMHGHLVGDEVLRAFAGKLQQTLREGDTVARFGGEEFIVLMPGTPEDAALDVMRRLLGTLAATPMHTLQDGTLFVTFSAGVATHGGYERFADMQELLKAADDVLYRSKNLGRNRVIARGPQREPSPAPAVS